MNPGRRIHDLDAQGKGVDIGRGAVNREIRHVADMVGGGEDSRQHSHQELRFIKPSVIGS